MNKLGTTTAATVSSTKETQRGYFNRLASIITAHFNSVMILLQVIL